jgi:hypothetical protein
MKCRILTAALAGAALIIGCDEQKAPTEAIPEPSFDWMNGPSAPGPVVLRWELTWVIAFHHEDETYVVFYGLGALDPSESVFCGGGTGFDLWAFQDINLPSGIFGSSSRSEVTTHIYAFDDYWDPGNATLCDRLISPRVAEGYAHVKYNDNDVIVSGTRADAYSFRGDGILSDVANGGYTNYKGIHKYVELHDGTFIVNQEKVTLR